MAETITCPQCGMTSGHPVDVAEGYCGFCHDYTGRPCQGCGQPWGTHADDCVVPGLIEQARRREAMRDGAR
jgi:hypothetical protein